MPRAKWYWVVSLVMAFLLLEGFQTQVQPEANTIILPKSTVARGYATRYKISYRLSSVILSAAKKYEIPPRIAFRLVAKESRFDSMARNTASSATGLTQILVATARVFVPGILRDSLHDPEVNVELGFRFLHGLHRRYRGDWWRALVGFYEGPAVADTITFGFHHYADLVLWEAK